MNNLETKPTETYKSQPENSFQHYPKWNPSLRLLDLLKDHQSSTPSLGAERALHYTHFFKKKAKGYHSHHIKMARALEYHLQQRSIRIYPNEYIVGSHTEHRIGAICHIELTGSVMLEDLLKFQKRKTNPLHVDKHQIRPLFGSMVWWTFRNLAMKAFPWREKISYLKDQLNASYFVINEAGGIAHFLPDYESIINLGTQAMREETQKRLKEIIGKEDNDAEQRDFLEARLIGINAIEEFADRYKILAEQQGLTEIIDCLKQIPRYPARNLLEALQMIWFFQLLIQVESLDQGISLGRIDQYLFPLYQKEIENQTFNADIFRDQFGAFCLKLSEVIPLFSKRVTSLFGGLPSGQALTLGGITKEGDSAENPLTFLMLDVLEKFKTRQPNWHARISEKSSPRYVKRVYEIIGGGGGSPALYNDDVIIPALRDRGFPEDKLYNYATVGCVEPALPGISFTSSDAAIFNVAMALDIVLGEGKRNQNRVWRSKRGMNSRNLDSYSNFEDFKMEVFNEMKHQIQILKNQLDKIELANRFFHPTPFSSLTVQGCLESAKDLSAGGALVNASGIQGVGIADLANSLIAIQELVYEKRLYSLNEIARACRENFKNHKEMQAQLLKAPKFGNDNIQVDNIFREIGEVFDRLISQNKNTRGGKWMPGGYSMTCHRAFGSQMSALPSGRNSGESLADGIAPTDGSDRLGPTASLNSCCKLNHRHYANGVNLNIKFDAHTIQRPGGTEVLESIIGGYFDQGGMQIQVNVLDPKVLKDAMENPDRHRNLLVRISGYCAYFVDLSQEMQQELCDRSLQVA